MGIRMKPKSFAACVLLIIAIQVGGLSSSPIMASSHPGLRTSVRKLTAPVGLSRVRQAMAEKYLAWLDYHILENAKQLGRGTTLKQLRFGKRAMKRFARLHKKGGWRMWRPMSMVDKFKRSSGWGTPIGWMPMKPGQNGSSGDMGEQSNLLFDLAKLMRKVSLLASLRSDKKKRRYLAQSMSNKGKPTVTSKTNAFDEESERAGPLRDAINNNINNLLLRDAILHLQR